jgi:curved DNA-binding protein CbpA
MREHTDLYAVLGISSTASPTQVRQAYRAELRRHHPDTRDPGSGLEQPGHDRALRQVLAAYAVLHDPVRRAAYDRLRRTRASIQARVAPDAPVVVLGDTGSAWPDRTRITPLQAWSAPGPRQWLLALLRDFGPRCR